MPTAVTSTDAELLERFLRRQDLAAFEVLLRRHGPMVYQVCQRVLHHPADADDAFQATFVVFVKKARTINRPDLVGGWLHGVAQRVAMKLRSQSAQRQSREKPLADPVTPAPTEPGWRELSPILDEELNQLPDAYRAPLVLCYLEGKTNDQAAEQLGWTRGKVAGKLSRGRDLLRQRLSRRGLTLTSAALGGLLLQQTTTAAAIPAALQGAAMQAASSGAAAAAGLLSAKAVVLAEGVQVSSSISAKVMTGVVLASLALAGTAAFVLEEPRALAVAFQNFDGAAVPSNRAGQGYPNPYDDTGSGGRFTASIQTEDAIAGSCLQMRLTSGWLKAQFDPNEQKGRSFTRDFAVQPGKWQFNTYNRFRFWIKTPAAAKLYATNGQANMGLGTYVKRVQGADIYGLDTGGGSFYHLFNVPATGQWTQVVLNMHPHWQGKPGSSDLGNLPHPTGEPDHNYFDALTRFYLEARATPARYPADYFLDEMEFYREPFPENDEQVYGITATHLADQQRIILTWSRRQGEDALRHEVRFAFRNIHEIGWEAAEPAPGGWIKPTGTREANGMVYDSSALPLQGRATIYLAIRPENASLFSQVAIRLTRK